MDETKNAKIMLNGKDYIGGADQLPMALRLMDLLVDLFFCNGYCVSYKIKKDCKSNDKTCQEGGWSQSRRNSKTDIKQRRSNVSI
jgi:hypothetical protein